MCTAAAASPGAAAPAPPLRGGVSLLRQPHRAADAGATEAAVALGVLGEVLLVVVLGVVELGRREDLGGDRAVARLAQHLLVRVPRGLGGALLRVTEGVDAG